MMEQAEVFTPDKRQRYAELLTPSNTTLDFISTRSLLTGTPYGNTEGNVEWFSRALEETLHPEKHADVIGVVSGEYHPGKIDFIKSHLRDVADLRSRQATINQPRSIEENILQERIDARIAGVIAADGQDLLRALDRAQMLMEAVAESSLFPEKQRAYLNLVNSHSDTVLTSIAVDIVDRPFTFKDESPIIAQKEAIKTIAHRAILVKNSGKKPQISEEEVPMVGSIVDHLKNFVLLQSMGLSPERGQNSPQKLQVNDINARISTLDFLQLHKFAYTLGISESVLEEVVNRLAPNPTPSHLPRA